MNSENFWLSAGVVSFGFAFGYWYDPVLLPFGMFFGAFVTSLAWQRYDRANNSGISNQEAPADD